MRSSPDFFRTNKIGWPYGEADGRIQPFANISSICLRTSTSLGCDIRYMHYLGIWAFSSTKSMRCVKSRSGGISGASNTSANSSKIESNSVTNYCHGPTCSGRNSPNQATDLQDALNNPRILQTFTYTLLLLLYLRVPAHLQYKVKLS